MKSKVRFEVILGAALIIGGISVPAGAQIVERKKPQTIRDRLDVLEMEAKELNKGLSEILGTQSPEEYRQLFEQLQGQLEKLTARIEELAAGESKNVSGVADNKARIDDLFAQVSSLSQQNKKLTEEIERRSQHGYTGYREGRGFFLASPDAAEPEDAKFQLWLSAYLRPTYSMAFQEEWEKDPYGRLQYDENGNPQGGDMALVRHGFGFENARIDVRARAWKLFLMRMSMDLGRQTGRVIYPVNADLAVPEGQGFQGRLNRVVLSTDTPRFLHLYGQVDPTPWLSVRFGQFKVAFDRETLVPANRLTFSTRSLVTRRYAFWGQFPMGEDAPAYHWDYEWKRGSSFGYDRGVSLSGRLADGLFNYEAGVFNGSGVNEFNDNLRVLAAVRLWSDMVIRNSAVEGGSFSGMSDLENSADPQLSVGVGFGYDMPENTNPNDPANPAADFYSEEICLTADAAFKWMGLSAFASFFYRKADYGDTIFEESDISSIGVTGQLAYYHAPTRLEPAVRYSVYDADMEFDGDNVHELTGALNYYVRGNNLKVGVEYRGIYPNDMSRAYVQPIGTWFDYWHELTVAAQFGF